MPQHPAQPIVQPFAYRRQKLAQDYCDALAGRSILDASAGLFLAAPRRTGKSTFLRQDLVPEMVARGWGPVYVDLWSDRSEDPAELIAAAIRAALAGHDGLVLKAAKQVGLDRLNVMGTVSLDLAKIGQTGGATLADALAQLRQASKQPIALLVDEAQHALSTPAGMNAMFALKAARDQLNQGQGGERGLYVVMTGSNRDKLSHLTLRKTEPFYGAGITRFPLLDRGFVAAYADWLNPQFTADHRFSADALEQAFDLVGRRPEMLKQVVGAAVADLGGAKALDELLQHNAAKLQRQAWQEFESAYAGLTAKQKAVLDVVARLAPDYQPYADDAQAGYRAVLGEDLRPASVQTALKALRDQGLIWQAGRGDYAFDDDGLRAWYLSQHPEPPRLA